MAVDRQDWRAGGLEGLEAADHGPASEMEWARACFGHAQSPRARLSRVICTTRRVCAGSTQTCHLPHLEIFGLQVRGLGA